MKRIITLFFIVLMLIAVFTGCTYNRGTEQSPGFDYPGDQENLNNYNNGLSKADNFPPVMPGALE